MVICLFLRTFAGRNNKDSIMTSVQLNAELLRNMSIIAEDENLLKRAVKYLRKLIAEKDTDPTAMTKEEFFARISDAEKQIADGKGITFTNRNDMNDWLNSL